MDVITRGAHVSRASFYIYFENKTDILVELGQVAVDEFLIMSDSFERSDSLDETIIRGTRGFVDLFMAHRPVLRILYGVSLSEPDFTRLMKSLRDRTFRLWTSELEYAVRTGQCRPLDPSEIAHAFVAMLESLCIRYIFDELGEIDASPDEISAIVADLWLRSIG